MSAADPPPIPDAVVDALAAAVLAHPAVAALDGGPFGTVTSYLPGRRRVLGVRITPGGGVEVSVVARTDPAAAAPLTGLADELATVVRGVLGPGSVAAPVEVTIADVVLPAATVGRASGSQPLA